MHLTSWVSLLKKKKIVTRLLPPSCILVNLSSNKGHEKNRLNRMVPRKESVSLPFLAWAQLTCTKTCPNPVSKSVMNSSLKGDPKISVPTQWVLWQRLCLTEPSSGSSRNVTIHLTHNRSESSSLVYSISLVSKFSTYVFSYIFNSRFLIS